VPLPGRKDHVLFIDAAARFEKIGPRSILGESDIEAVVSGYQKASDPDGEGGIALSLVPLSVIEANEWDLNVGLYAVAAGGATLDFDEALDTYYGARAALREVEARLDERLREAGLRV